MVEQENAANAEFSEGEVRRLINGVAAQKKNVNYRRSQRYSIKQSVSIEFLLPPNHQIEITTGCDISRDGIGVQSQTEIPVDTSCRVSLIDLEGKTHIAEGVVVLCVESKSDRNKFHLGIRFLAPLDIALFCQHATTVQILLVDEDDFQCSFIGNLLEKNGAKASFARSPREAVDLALSNPFDLVLINFDAQTFSGCEIVRELRGSGYVRPVASVSSLSQRETQRKCQQRNCTDCRVVELSHPALVELVVSIKSEPVNSSLAKTPNSSNLVNQFVFSIQDRINELEDAFQSRDVNRLLVLLRRLEAFSQCCGFDSIADAANKLSSLSAKTGALAANRDRLNRLYRLCLAARPASLVDEALRAG